jgi:soluble lytic murein transglycosylase-like protein
LDGRERAPHKFSSKNLISLLKQRIQNFISHYQVANKMKKHTKYWLLEKKDNLKNLLKKPQLLTGLATIAVTSIASFMPIKEEKQNDKPKQNLEIIIQEPKKNFKPTPIKPPIKESMYSRKPIKPKQTPTIQATPIREKTKNYYDIINPILEKIDAKPELTNHFIRAIIKQESDDENPLYMISTAGAKGAIQVMPCVWEEVHGTLEGYEENAMNTKINIETGTKYLNKLASHYLPHYIENYNSLSTEKKQELIAMTYNGGIGRANSKNFNLKFMSKETQNYVPSVSKLKNKFKNN